MADEGAWTLGGTTVGNALVFTDSNFEAEVLKSDVPVLVDFWAPWCGPCRQIAPVIDQLAVEYTGTAKIGKMDVDQSPQTPQKFGVMNIPTLIVFKGGQQVQRFQGVQSKARLKEALDEAGGMSIPH
jgi:thioredoxin 1